MKKKTKSISKNTLFIIVGLMFLISGCILTTMLAKNDEQPIYVDTNRTLSNEEANSLISEMVSKVVDLYEKKEGFTIVEDSSKEDNDSKEEHKIEESYIEVSNYDEVVKKLYTEEGIKELESTKFDNKSFVKKEDKVYILKDIPEDNILINSRISVSKIDVKKDSITGEVQFTKYGLVDDTVTYYIITKNIMLIKEDNKWLINSFIYANEV